MHPIQTQDPTQRESEPLYRRVADRIANHIYNGDWRPGEFIPNEFALADDFSVSQGTIRKAMSLVEEIGLVERQQGRGTFVRKLSEERSYYHFFRLAKPHGERVIPEPLVEQITTRKANSEECEAFQLPRDGSVIVVKRLRCVDGIKATQEHIVLPEPLFVGLSSEPQPIPSALYPFYHQRFGIFVIRAEEYIVASVADKSAAKDLEIAPSSAMLEVHRTAFDLKNRVVELRLSRFRSDIFHYKINLS